MKSNLIASAPTIKRLEQLAAQYFFAPCVIEPPFVYNASKTAVKPGFQVVKKGKRFILEMV
jgi:hypothetical protein